MMFFLFSTLLILITFDADKPTFTFPSTQKQPKRNRNAVDNSGESVQNEEKTNAQSYGLVPSDWISFRYFLGDSLFCMPCSPEIQPLTVTAA